MKIMIPDRVFEGCFITAIGDLYVWWAWFDPDDHQVKNIIFEGRVEWLNRRSPMRDTWTITFS